MEFQTHEYEGGLDPCCPLPKDHPVHERFPKKPSVQDDPPPDPGGTSGPP